MRREVPCRPLVKSLRTVVAVTVGLLALVSATAVVMPSCEPEAKTEGSSSSIAAPPEFTDVAVESEQPTGLKLTGRVLDATGRPVAGATVSLAASAQSTISTVSCAQCGELLLSCDARESSTTIAAVLHGGKGFARAGATRTTDADGKFTFDGVSGVSFSVWASAAGFGSAMKERAAPGDPVEIFLPSLRAIAGTVLDESGQPVPGAHVHAVSRRLPLSAETQVLADGRFELQSLGEGPFYLLAEAPGFLPAVLEQVEAGPDPVRLRLSPPRVLQVRVRLNGEPVDAKVELSADHLKREALADKGVARFTDLFPTELTVSATAGNRASAPKILSLQDAVTEITLDLDSGGVVLVTVVDSNGEPVPSPKVALLSQRHETLFEKKAGTGELVSFGPIAAGDYLVEAWADSFKASSMPVKVADGEASVELVLERGTVIKGRVIDEYERPAPDVSVLVNPTGQTVYADRDGAFSVQVPTAGLYTLHAHHSDWGGGSVQVQAPAENVTLALEPRGGVQITVEANGRRVEGADAVMWLEKKDVFRSDRPSGPDGIVMMRGLPAGSYWMMATHDEYLPSERQRVEITDGDLPRLTVQLREGAKLTGEVVDETGAAVQSAFVITMPRSGEPTSTDATGRFSFRALKPGLAYRVEARHASYEQVGRATGTAGGDPVKIVMKRKQSFRGRVVSEDGPPLKRFRIDDRDVDSADGSFEVPLMEMEGHVLFSVEAQGFEPQTVERPATADLGDIVLRRSEMFTGIVKDELGAPVQDAVITCDMCDETVLTGADGRFTMAKPGMVIEYTVSARKNALTGSVEITGPRTLPVEIVLRADTKVSGTVYLANGQPAVGEEVEAISLERNEPISFVTGASGEYELDMPAGHYRFSYGDDRVFAGNPLLLAQVSGQTQRLDIGAAPGTSSLTLKVTPEPGHAIWVIRGGVQGAASPPTLNQAEWAQMLYQPRGHVVTLSGFPAGRYTVVWGHFYSYDAERLPKMAVIDIPATKEVDLTAAP